MAKEHTHKKGVHLAKIDLTKGLDTPDQAFEHFLSLLTLPEEPNRWWSEEEFNTYKDISILKDLLSEWYQDIDESKRPYFSVDEEEIGRAWFRQDSRNKSYIEDSDGNRTPLSDEARLPGEYTDTLSMSLHGGLLQDKHGITKGRIPGILPGALEEMAHLFQGNVSEESREALNRSNIESDLFGRDVYGEGYSEDEKWAPMTEELVKSYMEDYNLSWPGEYGITDSSIVAKMIGDDFLVKYNPELMKGKYRPTVEFEAHNVISPLLRDALLTDYRKREKMKDNPVFQVGEMVRDISSGF